MAYHMQDYEKMESKYNNSVQKNIPTTRRKKLF